VSGFPSHPGEETPCVLCEFESRLPDLDGECRLEAQARYIERLPERYPMTGEEQGEALAIAALIRDLARKLAA
jgi:hypothetical protein